MTPYLTVNELSASAGDKPILSNINLTILPGEVHVLLGPNGAGKSTLGNVILGNPAYQVTSGRIEMEGSDITGLTPDQRAKAGLYLSFQNPIEVPGLTLFSFIRTAKELIYGQKERLWPFRKSLEKQMEILNMDPSYLDRDLNVGFSGGEKKKAEILQLLALNPKLAILDETDSGLDVDAVKTVSAGIHTLMQDKSHALLIITHSTRILQSLTVDYVHILINGKIVKNGDASLIAEIERHGFGPFQAAIGG